jgi:hypothetical protein
LLAGSGQSAHEQGKFTRDSECFKNYMITRQGNPL